MHERLKTVCDIVTESHSRIQKDFADLNPLVGVNQKMREMDVPVDIVTIDCLQSDKRIILILHDHYPDQVRYQFAYKETDPAGEFEQIDYNQLTTDKVYTWITVYFQSTS